MIWLLAAVLVYALVLAPVGEAELGTAARFVDLGVLS